MDQIRNDLNALIDRANEFYPNNQDNVEHLNDAWKRLKKNILLPINLI